ncbi:transposase [Planctomicrobium sp. SH661]|uniref:transposase n=1 Tax=Planctomicrobium sp. SH661 TaxID=3448124 RepID=UPI003F5C5BC2
MKSDAVFEIEWIQGVDSSAYDWPGDSSFARSRKSAYISAVMDNLPDAELVFDRFHIMKRLNGKLTQLRRELFREAEGPLSKRIAAASLQTPRASRNCWSRDNVDVDAVSS